MSEGCSVLEDGMDGLSDDNVVGRSIAVSESE